jgi:putative oxidoreductase
MIRDLALLAARAVIGHGMAAHGAQKALGWFEGPGPAGAAQLLHGLGFRPGDTYASLASWTEVVSGEMIALGVGGPIGPAMLTSSMIVGIRAVHWQNGFFAQKGGFELGALYVAGAVALATDYGAISLDNALGLRETFKSPAFLALTFAGAIAASALVLGQRVEPAPDKPAVPTFRGKNSPLPETPEPAKA